MSSEEITEIADADETTMVQAARSVQKEIGESKEKPVSLLSGLGGFFESGSAMNDFLLIAAVAIAMWVFMKSF